MLKNWFGGSPSRATSSRVAFERTGEYVPGCPVGIYTINPDGSDTRHIRPSGQSPRWSPDGRWIAFSEGTRDNGGLQSVFVMRPTGADARQVTNHNDVDATPPCWSPDSKRLAYSLYLWSEKSTNSAWLTLQPRSGSTCYTRMTPSIRCGLQLIRSWFSIRQGNSDLRLFEVDPYTGQLREAALFRTGRQRTDMDSRRTPGCLWSQWRACRHGHGHVSNQGTPNQGHRYPVGHCA